MTGSDVRIYSYDYKLNIVAAKELCLKHEASHLTTMSQMEMLYTVFLDMELILKDIYIYQSLNRSANIGFIPDATTAIIVITYLDDHKSTIITLFDLCTFLEVQSVMSNLL